MSNASRNKFAIYKGFQYTFYKEQIKNKNTLKHSRRKILEPTLNLQILFFMYSTAF